MIPIRFVTILFMLILWPVGTNAELRLELGAGLATHAKRVDGLWYQNEYPNQHDLTSGAWQLGASWFTRGTPWRYGVRGAYVSLGKNSSSATVIEDEYDRGKELPCNRETRHGNCFARIDQKTSTQGWSLGPVIERDYKWLTGQLEAGLFFGESSVSADVAPISRSGEAQFNVTNNWSFRTWYAGAGMRYGYLTLNTRWYQNLAATGGFFGPRHAYTVMIGTSIPF